MPAVKLGASRQVAIPKAVCDELGLTPGVYLEVETRGGQVILTPKELVDRRLAEALKEIKAKKGYGPFDSAEEMLRSLHAGGRRSKKA